MTQKSATKAKTANKKTGPKNKGANKSTTKKPRKTKAATPKKVWESRAVSRLIEAGSMAECPHCGERVKFRARHRDQQIICNVYTDGVWTRVEQYHPDCYKEVGEPYGKPQKK